MGIVVEPRTTNGKLSNEQGEKGYHIMIQKAIVKRAEVNKRWKDSIQDVVGQLGEAEVKITYQEMIIKNSDHFK